MSLTLRVHEGDVSLAKLAADVEVPSAILAHPFTSFLRMADEATLICSSALMPPGIEAESDWVMIEFVGPFAFGLTGVLVQVAAPLADAGIPIMALSGFSTDYVLIKRARLEIALSVLRHAGHRFVGDEE